MVTILTQGFLSTDIYGDEVPCVTVMVELLRDVSYLAETMTLPDDYTQADRDRFHDGSWEFVGVRMSLHNPDGRLVARKTVDHQEYGAMEDGFVNPLSNPHDFPLRNLFDELVEDYVERDGFRL